MMNVKSSIVMLTILLFHFFNTYNLYADNSIPSFTVPNPWSYQQNNSINSHLAMPLAISREQSVRNFQQHFKNLLSQCYGIHCKQYILPALRHDCMLIEKICIDNLHYHQQELISKLAHNKDINQMSAYFKLNHHNQDLPENIIIDPGHFTALPQAEKRVNNYMQAAHKAMKKRHEKELDKLQSSYKKSIKNLSKSEKLLYTINIKKIQ